VAEDSLFARLGPPLQDLARWLSESGRPGAVIGGVAVGLLGRPRVTRDVDALVFLDRAAEWAAFLEEGEQHGFRARRSDALDFARRTRVLLLEHVASGVPVDVSLGSLPFEAELIRRARPVRVGRVAVPVARPEDLVVLKAVAGRPRDQADIESLLDAHPGLDLARVRRQVREFSEVLELPELLENLERLVGGARRRTRPRRRSRG